MMGGEGGGSLLRESIWIAKRTAVEIVRDAFPARGVFKCSTFASDGEECHEARLVEIA